MLIKMKGKVLVTGGTGYIGSHTVVELITAGYDVIIIDNLCNSSIEVIPRIKSITGKMVSFINLDIRNHRALQEFFKRNNDIDSVIHFAALKSVNESVSRPLAYYQNNIQGTINLLEAMKAHGVKNLVFSSSCTVYGSPDHLPVTEKSPIGYTPSPYGYTKQVCERLIEDTIASENDISAISLRYFNPIGAHESGLIGEVPSGPPNNLMPYITQTAAGVREFLSVYGDDYNTPDGTALRDYIHVVDLASAHVTALDRMMLNTMDAKLEYFNVGTGQATSVMEVIQSFEKMSGLKLNYKIVGRRPGDVEAIYADATRSDTLLGWKSRYNLDDMTSSAWVWEKNYRGIE